jgi:hypothetical protein
MNERSPTVTLFGYLHSALRLTLAAVDRDS